ncbi:hypothetical protein [Arthrobacter sunyaminii]|uniref:Uncharacterized protein n=1 Tax=Arthrobacter sunyaminii TaxID=2816859 RepID=A0A975S8I1_9MICC|nr:hypothetical protein [Arthrobacter sunyaminii]MBO0907001.1 hypothetical protein [Arthrobacter sunyaminii]QWQ37744.1 hypothetical protein KG104_08600 [Arthrobacter sunyaminii]
MVQNLRRRFGGLVLMNTGIGTVTHHEDAIMLLEGNLADTVVVGYTEYMGLAPVAS